MAVFIEGGSNGAKYAVPVAAQIYQYIYQLAEPLPPLLAD